MIHGELDYALTRIHARQGQRLRGDDWQSISSARSLAAGLARLRSSPAAGWAEGIGARSDAHTIEAQLRRRFGAYIEQLASWCPIAWQPALRWCALLVDLPALRRALTDEHDAPAGQPAIARALLQAAGRAPGLDIEVVWLAGLRQRLPALDSDASSELERALQRVAAHRRRFSQLPAGNGWPERESLQHWLTTRARREPLNVIQLLIAIALLLLDYERVRGELLRHAAEPEAMAP